MIRLCRRFRSGSSGRRSTRSCSASTTTTRTRRATSGSGPAASLDGPRHRAGLRGPSTAGGCTTATTVPGFPQHPHRGFETVTFVRQGLIDHSDSLGATARFGRGDVQWLTAGDGIVHCEMFPLLDTRRARTRWSCSRSGSTCPSTDKMVEPYFTMLWDADIPVVEFDGGTRSRSSPEASTTPSPPPPPPNSWAARDDAEVAIWRVRLDAGASWTMPPTRHADVDAHGVLLRRDTMSIGGHQIGSVDRRRRAQRRATVELRAGRHRASSVSCCKAARSASRSPSTGRS